MGIITKPCAHIFWYFICIKTTFIRVSKDLRCSVISRNNNKTVIIIGIKYIIRHCLCFSLASHFKKVFYIFSYSLTMLTCKVYCFLSRSTLCYRLCPKQCSNEE